MKRIRISKYVVLFGIVAGVELDPRPSWSEERHPSTVNNVVSLEVGQDFGIHSGTNPCSMQNQIYGGYACFRGSGTQYHGTPRADFGGTVRPTPQLATTRVLGGYDRILKENFLLGVRLGWVLRGGGPRPDGAQGPDFFPFHGEIRLGWVFGRNPFAHKGLRFSVFAGVGVAQVDTLYPITIIEDRNQPPPAAQLDNPDVQDLSAYRKSGTGFVNGGVTLAYALSQRWSLSLGTKLLYLYPSSGVILGLEGGAGMAF